MGEIRACRSMVSLEPSLQMLFNRVATEEGMSASNYLRRLVIQDLMARQLLTGDILARITTMSPREIDAVIQASGVAV